MQSSAVQESSAHMNSAYLIDLGVNLMQIQIGCSKSFVRRHTAQSENMSLFVFRYSME
jgi:hypothetical protein